MAYQMPPLPEAEKRHSKKMASQRRQRIWDAVWSNVIVFLVTCLWLIPVIWVVCRAFDANDTGYISQTFFPTDWTWQHGNPFVHFVELFQETDFGIWLLNTFLVSVVNTVLTTLVTVLTAFILSRFRFKTRKFMMNLALILGMFPGFMAMIAVYLILNMLGLIGSIWSLLLYYVAGAGLGFFTCKGYFDTIGKEIDEAAKLDGASMVRIFFQIFLPLAKPMIIYTALLAFMAPWGDYILAGLVLTASDSQTVAVGLYNWMTPNNINNFFYKFCAGSIVVAIPTVALYISLQRFFIGGISAGAIKG